MLANRVPVAMVPKALRPQFQTVQIDQLAETAPGLDHDSRAVRAWVTQVCLSRGLNLTDLDLAQWIMNGTEIHRASWIGIHLALGDIGVGPMPATYVAEDIVRALDMACERSKNRELVSYRH
jgi:hypothetical protein